MTHNIWFILYFQGKFIKKQMLEVEKISFQHLQWIYYRQAIDGRDEEGNYVQIQHAYFRGEIEFEGQKPDGYLFKDGKHFFYEYQGNILILFNIFTVFFRLLLAWLFVSSAKQTGRQLHAASRTLS